MQWYCLFEWKYPKFVESDGHEEEVPVQILDKHLVLKQTVERCPSCGRLMLTNDADVNNRNAAIQYKAIGYVQSLSGRWVDPSKLCGNDRQKLAKLNKNREVTV